MILSSILRTRKVKRFSFTPRYYNEDKENLEQRRAQIEAELKGERTIGKGSSISLRDKWQRSRKAPSILEKKSNIRLAVIISILSSMAYWILS